MSHNNIEFKQVKAYLDKNAIVLDVRTEAEYIEGHVEHSLHIVLDTLEHQISKVKTLNRPVITCCRSGIRSEHAKDLLEQHGIDVINGGPWQNVKNSL